MTDTTDIAALRERMMQQREAALTGSTPSFEDCELLVCDLLRALTLSNKQIEAERQRADEYKGQLKLEQHYSKTLSGTVDIVDSQRDHWMERARKAEAELAALKAKLTNPVVLGSSSITP